MQDIPLILETPSFEETSKNWNVWSKEIEVLNELSSSGAASVSSTTGGDAGVRFDSLMQDIRDVIKAAGGGKAVKITAQKNQKKKKGKKEEIEGSEDEE